MSNYREAKKKSNSNRIYFGWIRRFQGSVRARITVQEVGSQMPGRVVVRLSKCSNIYVRCNIKIGGDHKKKKCYFNQNKKKLIRKPNLRYFNAFIFKGSRSSQHQHQHQQQKIDHAKIRKK